jgi:hypothetical protein
MAVTTIPTAGLTLGAQVNFRNLIINGDMSIAQRGTSQASISTGYNTCDRWRTSQQIGAFTQSQSTDVPTGQGFATSLKMDCTTANSSPGSTSQLTVHQRLEGQMLQQLKKGTSNAESTTMSFWVKSNKTGTYTVEINDDDNSRQISKTYTINSSDTWEKKTITFEGDTTGTLDNDNARSVEVLWWLGAGSTPKSGTFSTSWSSTTFADRVSPNQVNLADNTANEWYITGVQLEVGTSASDFEFLPHDVNMQRCMRYLQHTPFITGANSMTAPTNEGIEIMGARHKFADVHGFRSETITHYVPMRVQPSFTFYNPSNSGTTGQFRLYDKDGNTQDFSGFAQLWDRYGFNMAGYTGVSVGTAGDTVWILGMHWKADAEL